MTLEKPGKAPDSLLAFSTVPTSEANVSEFGWFTHWRTLRFRLAVWNALVVVLISLVMLITVRQGLRWALLNETDQLLMEDIQEISLALRDMGPDEMGILKEELRRRAVGHRQHGWFAALIDAQGRTIWASNQDVSEVVMAPPMKPLTPYTLGEMRIVEMNVNRDDSGIHGIRVGGNLDSLYRDMAHLDRLATLSAAALLLIAPLSGYWLAGRAARTMGDIIRTASRLRPSHLEERLKLSGTGDELDQLSTTINHLLDRIAAYLQQKRDFLANAAHELRTPLAAIRSSVEVCMTSDQVSG
jgi:hypothetical protein